VEYIVLQAGDSSCYPTKDVKTLKETKHKAQAPISGLSSAFFHSALDPGQKKHCYFYAAMLVTSSQYQY